jgi:hypothetical protein
MGSQRAYALLVRLHDVYGMHSIFAPGFPGLLEAFYVQERLMEWLMPDVYKSFVGTFTQWGDTQLMKVEATEYDLLLCLGDEMVYYALR